jgi:glycosyltransferase involved in cell wall biosynthesis
MRRRGGEVFAGLDLTESCGGDGAGQSTPAGQRAVACRGFFRQMRRFVAGLRELVRPYYLKGLYFRLNEANCPHQFKECWNYASYRLDEAGSCLDPAMPGLADVVFLPMADWHTCMQRSQHLAIEFAAKGHRCFYVNPHLGREYATPHVNSPGALISRLQPRIWELHVHLPREPVFHERVLCPNESAMVSNAIRGVLDKAGSSEVLLLASLPLWYDVALTLRRERNATLVYDCHDLLAGFGNIAQDILDREQPFLQASDCVVFSSQWLLDHRAADDRALVNKCRVVRNAVTREYFRVPAEPAGTRQRGEGVRIGYAGALEEWFDADSVEAAAHAHPEWSFVLIGDVGAKRIQRLSRIRNIELVGYVHYEELAGYLAGIDVGIIPFVKNDLTMAVNPIKLYEYFSFGLPVVSTRIPEVEEFGNLVYLADDSADFVLRLEEAVQEADPALRRQRIQVAERESWSARCDELVEAIRTLAPG